MIEIEIEIEILAGILPERQIGVSAIVPSSRRLGVNSMILRIKRTCIDRGIRNLFKIPSLDSPLTQLCGPINSVVKLIQASVYSIGNFKVYLTTWPIRGVPLQGLNCAVHVP